MHATMTTPESSRLGRFSARAGGSLCALLLAAPAPATAAVIFLAEEPEVYAAVDRLNASGAMPGFLANNASPYPGVRLHNPEPIPLTRWFSFLGNVQYDLFVAPDGEKASLLPFRLRRDALGGPPETLARDRRHPGSALRRRRPEQRP